ncbi:MAG: YraN family protein [Halieaceae bacterium]|nr:YraN family protein [Halieaceae bacterium]
MQTVGQFRKRCAEASLSRQGVQSIARNFATRHCEINLIMLDEHHIAYVEVRYRSASSFGDTKLSVTAAKKPGQALCAKLPANPPGVAKLPLPV